MFTSPKNFSPPLLRIFSVLVRFMCCWCFLLPPILTMTLLCITQYTYLTPLYLGTSLSQNRAFAAVGPALWNDTPSSLRSVMQQGISPASLRSLKTFLFTGL